jgi:citrate/tricarballylate utilization protein
MPLADLVERGAHTMTVCNACRYCEQFCPVFPAIERRFTFEKADLVYLANLCHDCGECLYACQYAPPHEFDINVPRMLAQIRVASYEEFSWPRIVAARFRDPSAKAAIGLALIFSVALALPSLAIAPATLWPRNHAGNFYGVVSHNVMVTLFGGVLAFVVVALAVGVRRFWLHATAPVDDPVRKLAPSRKGTPRTLGPLVRALREGLTLRHLHPGSIDCVSSEEARSPWRRRCHHFTFYGFLLCVASTIVAAVYHRVFGWPAPYSYSSVPVLLGTTGGFGLLIGSTGLLALRRGRDPSLGGEPQKNIDESFIALLLLTAATGMALLLLRQQPAMGPVLIVHLGAVLALFVTLPYGKFVHGLYRLAALALNAREDATPTR